MLKIQVISGAYAGRIFTPDNVSCDQRYVQVWIGRRLEEFKLGFDCRWV